MKPADRARLTSALREHVGKVAEDLRGKIRTEASVRGRAKKLHADEQVGEDFEVWTDLLARRAAVLWVLKSVYVRVLEDRGLLSPGRILDVEAQQLFELLAPNLGYTAFLRWVYRDLASAQGGLPELFSVQPAEIVVPSDELSRELLEFWRHRDPDTGAHWSFSEEKFEGELMGDLYQELDPVVKDRFALCQTPDFVREFILDRTLTPAIETFGADEVRLLDPTCGSGHFLIDGLKRIVVATTEKHPDWRREAIVAHALDRVVGIDLNDYACALARTRLVMTAADLAGLITLADAARFHPHVYWADGLEQVERDEQMPSVQFSLFDTAESKPRSTLTRSDVRATLRKVFETGFHAVVANPPYISEKDAARKVYHREKVSKRQRYVSAYREYSLASPFTERCFQLASRGGYVGLLTSNNFMRREFGKPLIEKVMASLDLSLVVDTSQAHIPFHGTPTVLIFGRNWSPRSETIRAVMGRRGENGTPEDPARGKVWSSIVEGWSRVGFENEYVSVADLPRATVSKHPLSLGGGGAAELRAVLEAVDSQKLGTLSATIGSAVITGNDELLLQSPAVLARHRVIHSRPMVSGETLRDWACQATQHALWPNAHDARVLPEVEVQDVIRFLWPYRSVLRSRRVFGTPIEKRGIMWWGTREIYRNRFVTRLSIAFAKVATHNHFALDRGEYLFSDGSPVIKLPGGSSEDQHLALLGVLNSSTACFWMKQVFHNKGIRGQGGGLTVTDWEQFHEFDATKAKLFPIVASSAKAAPYAAELDLLGRTRVARTIRSILDEDRWHSGKQLRLALDARHAADFSDLLMMVALQEELDWLCYGLYGLDEAGDIVAPDKVEPCPPTWLPWNLAFAERDAANRAALARGEEPDEQPSEWWARHRWEQLAALPAGASPVLRKRVSSRRERTRLAPALALIEGTNFKRRWYNPDYVQQEQLALSEWLAERVEQAAKARSSAFSPEQLVATLQDDARVLAVCEVLTNRNDFNFAQIVLSALHGEAMPSHRFHIYKPSGLAKRDVWERTWADQRREDAGEVVRPGVPPVYGTGDFLKPEYWRHRGKLDLPKERFILFSEVPRRFGVEAFYGWAGWTAQQRLKAILAIDEKLEDGGVSLADRIALLDSAWRLVPDVASEDSAAASRLKAELQALVGTDGPSKEMLDDWRSRFPPPGGRGSLNNGQATQRTDRPRKRSVKKKSKLDSAKHQEES